MHDICCVGHITSDKIVHSNTVISMPGGTAFYFSHAMQHMDLDYLLVTSLAQTEMHYIDELVDEQIPVLAFNSARTVYFENNYAVNQDHRTQRVLAKADPFTIEQLQHINAKIFHLGPLLADDIPPDLVRHLADKATISLDVQGYLREVRDNQVQAIDWAHKKEVLKYVSILKADETEMFMLTGERDVKQGIRQLVQLGVAQALITNGSGGSVVYGNGIFYDIPAYPPRQLIDATGCGDTYMAGYLSSRSKGASYSDAGRFAAAMASLKMESPGPFTGTVSEVYERMQG